MHARLGVQVPTVNKPLPEPSFVNFNKPYIDDAPKIYTPIANTLEILLSCDKPVFKFSGNSGGCLTDWGRVTHICFGNQTIIGSDNGLSPGRHQAIIWTEAELLLIEPLGTNFSEILIEIHTFSLQKMHLKISSGKWRPFCLGLNELRWTSVVDAECNSAIYQYFHPKLNI